MADSNTIKIKGKISSYKLVDKPEEKQVVKPVIPVRTEMLQGATYKLKVPEHVSQHALYITINDIVVDGKRKPFEIFINTKSMEHFQWVVALTRVISAIFRREDELDFLVEELKSVFDPKGGYWHDGAYVGSLISGIGNVINKHLNRCVWDNGQESVELPQEVEGEKEEEGEAVIPNAVLCPKCLHKTLVKKDGCETCLNCGESKCG